MPFSASVLAFVVALTSFALPSDDDTLKSAKAVEATRTVSTVQVDGYFNEEDWARARPATGFYQLDPLEGAPASQPTEVRVLYGDNNLYIGAMMYDEDSAEIQANLGRRDVENQADWFYLSIDSYFDRQTAYTFGVNAAGVQRDGLRSGNSLDSSWDAIWETTTRVTDEGWIAEIRIPYSMLRFSSAAQQIWGIQFQRKIPRLNETSEWRLIPRSDRGSGLVSQYGILQGIEGISPGHNIEVTPYTVSRMHTQESGPLYSEFDAGVDFKYGISSNITFDATINPDFGQVEADPAELNLSAFETFHPERRPFFLEGAQIFDFNQEGGSMLYTRRIGAEAPVIGASKITGRTPDGLSFGVLGATTGSQFTPERYYSAARVRQEFQDQSYLGGLLTYTNKPGATDRHQSVTGGTDWTVRFAENTYSVEGGASFTHRRFGADDTPVTGFAGNLRFSRLRGDFTYWAQARFLDDNFDPNDIGSLNRPNYYRFNGGLDYQYNSGVLGLFRRADTGFWVSNSWSWVEQLNQGLGFSLSATGYTHQEQRISLEMFSDYFFGGYDLYETRGLGPRAQPREFDVELDFRTDDRRDWQLSPEISAGMDEDGGRDYSFRIDGDWNVGSRIELSSSLQYDLENNITSWAANETFLYDDGTWHIGARSAAPSQLQESPCAPGDEPALLCELRGADRLDALLSPITPYDNQGHYYVPVFGSRDTRSIDMSVRSNITFFKNLSLELYGQLLVARGQLTISRSFSHRRSRSRSHRIPSITTSP